MRKAQCFLCVLLFASLTLTGTLVSDYCSFPARADETAQQSQALTAPRLLQIHVQQGALRKDEGTCSTTLGTGGCAIPGRPLPGGNGDDVGGEECSYVGEDDTSLHVGSLCFSQFIK